MNNLTFVQWTSGLGYPVTWQSKAAGSPIVFETSCRKILNSGGNSRILVVSSAQNKSTWWESYIKYDEKNDYCQIKIFYSKQLRFWPSTTRSARHSASPNWLVARTLYVPASSRNTSGMTRKLFWYMCEIWKSREGWISTPSRYQRISGVGKPVKLTSILTNNSWCKILQLIMKLTKKGRADKNRPLPSTCPTDDTCPQVQRKSAYIT